MALVAPAQIDEDAGPGNGAGIIQENLSKFIFVPDLIH
jgi:hypothetical protein